MMPERFAVVMSLAVAASACGRDPILEAADQLEARPQGGGQPGGQPGGPPAPGQPVDPSPAAPQPPAEGQPVEPPPGTPVEPPPGEAQGSGPAVEGPTVVVAGRVELEDYDLGSVRIDVFDGDQRNLEGPRPSVVAVLTLERPGPFELNIPESVTQVWLGAYVDENLDGRPGPQDPAGWYSGNPVATKGGADGIVIELVRQPPPPQHGL